MPLKRRTYRPRTVGITFRGTEQDKSRLDELSDYYGMTNTEVLITLIDDAWEKTFPDRALKPRSLDQMLKAEDLNRRYPDE